MGDNDSAPDKVLDWEKIPDAVPRHEPLSDRGNPESYVVNGQRYFVTFDTNEFRQQGIASWYGTKFHGRLTSSGEPYDMYQMTAAHKSLPLPSYVKVTNLHNNKQIIVKVNDRGPFVDGRIIDLSYAAAKKLDITSNGTANVEIEIIKPTAVSQQISAPQSNHIAYTVDPGNNYFVQLGAFTQKSHAEKLRNQLSTHEISPVSIHSLNNTSGEIHKVRVGPFTSKQQLESIESRLLELGYSQSYIIVE